MFCSYKNIITIIIISLPSQFASLQVQIQQIQHHYQGTINSVEWISIVRIEITVLQMLACS